LTLNIGVDKPIITPSGVTYNATSTSNCLAAAWALGSEIAATVAERAFYSLSAPVLRVSGFDVPFPPAKLETLFLPDADRILDAVDRVLSY
jgi:pyruvate/2-oxoglutarate/acetoin dehydrogenase E1 component